MTNPPQDDDREGGSGQQPGAWPPQPEPTGPPQPAPGSQYGQTWQPPGQQPYGPPQGQPPYGPPPYAQPAYGQPAYGQQPQGQPAYGPPGYGPPPYGQPGYGPPPYGQPQPATKSKAGRIAAILGAAAVLVVGGILLAFLLRSEVLDPRAVERDVAAQFEEREGVAIDLDCGDDMTVENGADYECSGVTADEEEVTLQITVTDEETAAYTWTEP